MNIDKKEMPRSLAEYIYVRLGGHSVYHYQTVIVEWLDKLEKSAALRRSEQSPERAQENSPGQRPG